MVTTRRQLLLLLRKHPGATVSELARLLGLTGMAVRRHLDSLSAEGLALRTEADRKSVGRPPGGWCLSPAGLELFPRRYDVFALDMLEDLDEQVGPGTVERLFRRRTDKQVAEYRAAIEDDSGQADDVSHTDTSPPQIAAGGCGSCGIEGKVETVTRLRDEAGYLAEWQRSEDGDFILTENNCAVHRVAQSQPAVCAMELDLLQQVFGPDADVSRQSHTMAGDAVCSYRISLRHRR